MNGLLKTLVLGALIFTMSHSTFAAEQSCSVQDQSDTVVLMYCPSQLVDQAWIDAAKAACMKRVQCNVWIWNDRTNMPKTAPKTDAELDKKHTAAAVAIWINDSQSLMKLRKVR